jgi:tetratricopeptide (TPR) repeat protein
MHKLFLTLVIISTSLISVGQKVSFMDKLIAKKLIGEGKELFYAGRTSEAMLTFKRAKLKNPKSGEAHYQLSIAQFYLRNYYSAHENARVAEKLISKKKDGEYYYYVGRIYHTVNLIDSARSFYAKSKIKLGPRIAKDYDLDILLNQCDFVSAETKKGIKNICEPFSRAVNSKYDEYGAILIYTRKDSYLLLGNPKQQGTTLIMTTKSFLKIYTEQIGMKIKKTGRSMSSLWKITIPRALML